MLYFIKTNGKVTRTTNELTDAERQGRDYTFRMDFETMAQAEEIAQQATEATGELHIATVMGGYPKFDVIRAPHVGDDVSYAFNGDYYPDSKIVSISKTLKVCTTESGKRYYRQRQTGSWKLDSTWSMVRGTVERRNPHF